MLRTFGSSVIVEGLLGMLKIGSYCQDVLESPPAQSLGTYLVPLPIAQMEDTGIFPGCQVLAIYPNPVLEHINVTTTGPNGFNASIIINQR